MIRKKTAPQSFAPVLNSSSTQLHSNSYHRDKGFLHALELNESPFPKVGSPGKGEEEGGGGSFVSLRSTPYVTHLISHCSNDGFPSLLLFTSIER